MLDFEFCRQENCDIAHYKGYTVKAIRDDNAVNPWEDWCHQPPLAVKYDSNIKTYSKEFGDALDPIAYYSDGQINRHWKKIVDHFSCAKDYGYFPYTVYDLNDCVTEKLEEWGENPNKPEKGSLVEARREILDECIKDAKFDDIAKLWSFIGVDALSTVSRGYSQSDYAELLIVFTPDIIKKWGQKKSYYKKTVDDQLQSSADLYSAWAWGDVYGYVIEDENEEHIDSCWGFYGSDHSKSGLLEQAESSLEYHIKEKSKKRFSKTKELIKNKVPLYIRKDIIASL